MKTIQPWKIHFQSLCPFSSQFSLGMSICARRMHKLALMRRININLCQLSDSVVGNLLDHRSKSFDWNTCVSAWTTAFKAQVPPKASVDILPLKGCCAKCKILKFSPRYAVYKLQPGNFSTEIRKPGLRCSDLTCQNRRKLRRFISVGGNTQSPHVRIRTTIDGRIDETETQKTGCAGDRRTAHNNDVAYFSFAF